MNPAQHLLLHQAELLAGGELPLAGEAGEAGKVVGIAPCSAHPVAGVDLPAAAGTLGTEPAVGEKRRGEGRQGDTGVRVLLLALPLTHPAQTHNTDGRQGPQQCRPAGAIPHGRARAAAQAAVQAGAGGVDSPRAQTWPRG